MEDKIMNKRLIAVQNHKNRFDAAPDKFVTADKL
jgi:hypothetical protein